MPFRLTVDGAPVVPPANPASPTTLSVGQSILVSYVPPNLSATSDSAHVVADTESAPNTRSVVLRAMSYGTANITLDFEGFGTQTLTVNIPHPRRVPSGPLTPLDHP